MLLGLLKHDYINANLISMVDKLIKLRDRSLFMPQGGTEEKWGG